MLLCFCLVMGKVDEAAGAVLTHLVILWMIYRCFNAQSSYGYPVLGSIHGQDGWGWPTGLVEGVPAG